MADATNYAENKIVDFIRAQAITLPTDWHVGLLSSFDSDDSPVEFEGSDYSRQPVTRSLTAWAGTQSDGSVLASSGTSHKTSNNAEVDFGSGLEGTATHWGLFDASTGGNLWFAVPLPVPLPINVADEVTFEPGEIAITVGLSGGLSNYASNRLIDLLFRAQAFTWPNPMWVGYVVSDSSNSAPGAEPVGGYERASLASSLTAMSGTQGANTTTASDGESGQTSNNVAVTFPIPTGSQGDVRGAIVMDASTLGNMLLQQPLRGGAIITISEGMDAPSFAPGQLTITVR